jgi:hypothetical protein
MACAARGLRSKALRVGIMDDAGPGVPASQMA